MKYLIFISLIFLFHGINYTYSIPHTIGTEFVFSYANIDRKHETDHYKFFLTNDNNVSTIVNMQWWSIKKNAQQTASFTLKPYGVDSYEFKKEDILFTQYSGYGQISEVPENRIMLTASSPIRIVSQVWTKKPDFQDLYLVPCTKSVGKNYMVQLPEPSENEFQLIQLLPLKQDAYVNVTHYVNGKFLTKSTTTLKANMGNDQQVMVRQYHPTMINSSYLIEASVPIAIVAAVTCVSTQSGCDYTAYMPQQLASWDGVTTNTYPDNKFLLTENTKNVFIYPPATGAQSIPIQANNENTTVLSNNIPTLYTYQYNPSGTVEYQITTVSSSLRASRHLINGDYILGSNGGSCLTNILSLSNFITGRTFFAPYRPSSFIEVYTKETNMNSIYLNNIPLVNLKSHVRVLSVTKYAYVALIIDLSQLNADSYLLYSDDKYIAYYIDTWENKMACYELGYNN
uniref:IgGFc_binding domain-containing protein n=1 Tax=Strongyloides papillosus TaxID=174720 RepID=A0A0N5CGW2_STREA